VNESSRAPVSLLPLFRSEAQYRLLGELYTNPSEEFTIGGLAERTGASHATMSREVARLETAGLVSTREEGRRRLVSAQRGTPVFGPLRDLLAKVYGVPALVADEFGHLGGRIVIFGSWAARWAGRPGPPPNDVDVLVVGDVDPADAWEAAANATRRLGMEVNVVVRGPSEWADDPTGFAEEVKQGPIIEVTTARSSSSSPAEAAT
jgi:DNA-binding transcriptional ArsR family regulator